MEEEERKKSKRIRARKREKSKKLDNRLEISELKASRMTEGMSEKKKKEKIIMTIQLKFQ